jgi:hypothetical protein
MARHLEEISLTILAANAECDQDSGGSLAEGSDSESSVSPIQETMVLADAAEGDTGGCDTMNKYELCVRGKAFSSSWHSRQPAAAGSTLIGSQKNHANDEAAPTAQVPPTSP